MSLDRSEPVPSCASAGGQNSPPEVARNSQPTSTKANGERTTQSLAESQRSKKETDVSSSSALGASELETDAAEIAASLEDNQAEDVSRSVSADSSSSSSISRSSSSVSQSQKEAETK